MTLKKTLLIALALVASPAMALDLGHIVRPIDATLNPELAEMTLRQIKVEEGPMSIGRAVATIGRADLLQHGSGQFGFDSGSLEGTLGGQFGNGVLEEHSFSEFQQVSGNQRANRVNQTRSRYQ